MENEIEVTEEKAKLGLFYVELKGDFEGACTLLLARYFRLHFHLR